MKLFDRLRVIRTTTINVVIPIFESRPACVSAGTTSTPGNQPIAKPSHCDTEDFTTAGMEAFGA